jgi:hypothetical protein
VVRQSYAVLERTTRETRETVTFLLRKTDRTNEDPGAHVIGLILSIAITLFGYATARRFVRDRLKFVDAAQTWRAPLVAGVASWALALPVAWLLPFITAPMAILFGVSVALGTRAGARDIRVERRLSPGQI